ncbi:MAG TPA: PKD domain-containing protein [Candidatus Eisenbacteria bacterium]
MIAILLSTTVPGGVGVTDDSGNSYTVDLDQADGSGLDRLVLLSARNVRSLPAGGRITVTFPLSAGAAVTADEFIGPTATDATSSGSGSGTTFDSGLTLATSQPVELIVAVAGTPSGATPGWSSGWTPLPALSVGSGNLGTAYKVSSSSGGFSATGSISGTWMAGVAAYTVPAPLDNPPTARLAVSQVTSPALTVNADGSGSTDGDATPIASYRFDFGDGSAAVTTTAPTAAARHTYAAAGTYTVTLVATDTGGKSSTPASASVTVTAAPTAQVAVLVAYYDTHHSSNIRPKPDPWEGSTGVAFVGTPDGSSGGWDSGAISVDNLSGSPLSGVYVTADIGSHHYSLWGTQTIPAGGKLILAQTSLENFDGSDTNPAGCYGCDPNQCVTMVSHTIPVVHVTVGGVTTTYSDDRQVLNTGGVDAAGCPATGTRNDESRTWQQVYPQQSGSVQFVGAFTLSGWGSGLWLDRPTPNPTRGDLTVRFSTASRGTVRLGVYDLAGRLVVPCVDGVLDPGQYNLQLNLGRMSPGMYIVNLASSEGAQHHTFAFVR